MRSQIPRHESTLSDLLRTSKRGLHGDEAKHVLLELPLPNRKGGNGGRSVWIVYELRSSYCTSVGPERFLKAAQTHCTRQEVSTGASFCGSNYSAVRVLHTSGFFMRAAMMSTPPLECPISTSFLSGVSFTISATKERRGKGKVVNICRGQGGESPREGGVGGDHCASGLQRPITKAGVPCLKLGLPVKRTPSIHSGCGRQQGVGHRKSLAAS